MFKDDASDPMGYFRDISTFGGCTSGPAAALENMRIIEEEGLLENTVAMGERLVGNLRALMEKHAAIGDVRGDLQRRPLRFFPCRVPQRPRGRSCRRGR